MARVGTTLAVVVLAGAAGFGVWDHYHPHKSISPSTYAAQACAQAASLSNLLGGGTNPQSSKIQTGMAMMLLAAENAASVDPRYSNLDGAIHNAVNLLASGNPQFGVPVLAAIKNDPACEPHKKS